MKTNILIINGHPDEQSFCTALGDAYESGSRNAGIEVRRLNLGKLDFNPNLQFGYRQRTELEVDLIHAQQQITWADHLVWVYPTWWGSMPAIMKGFIDRVFLPGYAFKYREHSQLWDKLLAGKSARLIITTDTPAWYNRLVYRQAGYRVMKNNVLQFCGINPVRITEIGPVKPSTEKQRSAWLERIGRLGATAK
ncbi:NAD(P)H-dependent oxidoreductase [Paenibacillus lemnae]|uniref:NAD(P)H-dependent oxidoreductase n=1 Tax=Paenibacillus lemnae TaxID=1330551 RepID=A0A848M5C4_PAELE|nr:NAD(P)H-dependent oxidoreductase [Paenibacillus lemnae]NMO95430.1 NAD(P)H-dependent oxidoreductase [Paenibacillus lemnae]